MQAYKALEVVFTKLYHFNHLLALGGWDAQVNMPPGAAEARGLAMAQLEDYTHSMLTDPEVGRLLEEALKETANSSSKILSVEEMANLSEMQRCYQMESSLPADFVQRKCMATTKAQFAWQDSRANNDFATFLPTLQELVALAREEGSYRASGSPGKPAYEALMDMYEPGITLDRIDTIFNDTKSWLPQLLQEVLAAQKTRDAANPITPLPERFPIAQQEALGRAIMTDTWRFDFNAGRLDTSAHPFTGMTKEDSRVTTHYCETDFEKSLYGVIHETGHAKYEQNMGPRALLTQPVCNARSLGIHESQSLFAEKMIARSGDFTEYLVPLLKKHFGEQEGFTASNLRRLTQRVQPGMIRVTADEVCYPLHVILRYEIERDLIGGAIEAADVPHVWNEKMKAYLGIETIGKDNNGCLQDMHWSGGAFGYFPTYTLGAMFAAQLMASIKKELGEDKVKACLRTGNLDPILAMQKEKIWNYGSMLSTDELMIKATGETLNTAFFREHLERRYLRFED